MVKINSILTILIITVVALFLMGCSSDNEQSNIEITGKGKAICGNNLIEKGESSDTCCLDVPCQDGFECESQFQDGDSIYFCKKLSKIETYEYEKFLEYKEDINDEYDKSDESLMNWGTMLSKSQSMSEYINELERKGYDVSVDKEYMKHFDRRIKLNKMVYEKGLDFDYLSEVKQKEILSEVIELFQNEKSALESINQSMKIKLDQEFKYDINGKIDYALERIAVFEELGKMLEKGLSAEIDVSSYDSTCHYNGNGYITSVNVGIENTGGFEISDPKLDFFVLDNGFQVAKEINAYFGYEDLRAGEQRFDESTFMLGYSGGESIECKTYDLKINLRSGADPKIIATRTVKVTME